MLWHSHKMLVFRKSSKEVTVTLIWHSNDFKHKICSSEKWGRKLYCVCLPKLQLIGIAPVWLLPHEHWTAAMAHFNKEWRLCETFLTTRPSSVKIIFKSCTEYYFCSFSLIIFFLKIEAVLKINPNKPVLPETELTQLQWEWKNKAG